MTSSPSLPNELPWAGDYKDLGTEYLSDQDASYLYDRYPNLPKSPDRGCPTCEGEKTFRWHGEDHKCECNSQLQLHKHYLLANIGVLYQRLCWEDYTGDPKAQDLTHLYLTKHKEMTRAGLGLIYHGGFGTGKTMLVTFVAKELVKLGYTVYFTTFSEMIDQFTKGWGDNAARARFEKKIVESEVFILDDVGKEFRTKNNLAESTFDHVLRQRAVDARPILLTTNMEQEDLVEGYGAAIFSLLRERSVIHQSNGDDYRSNARERTLDEVFKGEIRPIV